MLKFTATKVCWCVDVWLPPGESTRHSASPTMARRNARSDEIRRPTWRRAGPSILIIILIQTFVFISSNPSYHPPQRPRAFRQPHRVMCFEIKNFVVGPYMCIVMIYVVSLLFFILSMLFLISSRSLLGSILSSRTDPLTIENVDFTMEILTFLKNQRFRSKDGFESVLGLSQPPFGSYWGSPGGLLGAPSGLWIDQRGPPDSSWNSLGPRLLASCCRRWLWERSGAVFASVWVLPRVC